MVTVIDFGHNFGLSRLVLNLKNLKKNIKKIYTSIEKPILFYLLITIT